MSVYKTEEEQIDDLKRWLKSYGPSILAGIVLAIVVLYGWRYWKTYQHNQAVSASVLYQQTVDAYQTKRTDLLTESVATLKKKYTRSPYTQYAVFIQAKVAADEQDYPAADTALSWIIANSHDKNITAIAELRLGSIQIANHEEITAIKTLEKVTTNNPAFKGLALIKIADAYLALGDSNNAKINYEAANKLLPDSENTIPTLALKLGNATTT